MQFVQYTQHGEEVFHFHNEKLNQPLPAAAFQPPVEVGTNLKSDDWFERKLGPADKRFLTIKDGCGWADERQARREGTDRHHKFRAELKLRWIQVVRHCLAPVASKPSPARKFRSVSSLVCRTATSRLVLPAGMHRAISGWHPITRWNRSASQALKVAAKWQHKIF